MTKTTSTQSSEQLLLRKWWVRLILAAVFLAVAYGFASWAIDSGSWLAYGLGFFFIGWAIVQLNHAVRYLLKRTHE